MKVLLSWIRDFVDVPGTPESIGERMSLRGLALEGIEAVPSPAGSPAGSPGRERGDDAVLDFDVTANRPDCLSIIGIAREIATAYGLPIGEAPTDPIDPKGVAPSGAKESGKAVKRSAPDSATLPVTIDEADLCARYVAAIADVTIGPSPGWMQARLQACGTRPINNVVDITNYVLLETGHPMHAFDLARLRGPSIVVRRARAGETLTTLDGKKRTLDAQMLVIADAKAAVAIAGVMGGSESEVSETTQSIVFESAWFKPQSVRATSKRLGLRTEASYRFERGADVTAARHAMARALALLESTGAGTRRGDLIDTYPRSYEERELHLDQAAIGHLLGMEVPESESERILTSLGFGVKTLGGWQAAAPDAATSMGRIGSSWRVTVPPWRVDVARPVDLIEEVGRHYGFEHLPITFPGVEQAPAPSDPRIARDNRVRRAMLGMGFNEAVTFGFIESSAAEPYLNGDEPVVLANPLSEKFTTLRPSLIPGLVDAVSHNRRHGRRDVRLFEIGTRFSPRGEIRAVAAAWTGVASSDHWSGGARQVDFFDVKGVVEQVCALMNVTAQVAPTTSPYLVEGRAATIQIETQTVAVFGQLDPKISEQRDLPAADPVYVLEVNIDALTAHAPDTIRFAQPLPRHPAVVRDVSILIDEVLSADTVRGTIRAAAPTTLVDVREFDRYQGKGIAEGKVSLSLRLTFQAPDRTLTDAEVQAAMEQIVAALTRDLNAVQR